MRDSFSEYFLLFIFLEKSFGNFVQFLWCLNALVLRLETVFYQSTERK